MSQQKLDARTAANIASLQPDFAARVRQWLAASRAQGLNPLIHFGSRGLAEQQSLHQKYLDHQGPKAVAPERSYHCYGRAFDWVNITDPDAGESGLDWDDDTAYAKGVQIGGAFKIVGIGPSDNDHLQDGNYPSFTDLPRNELGHFSAVDTPTVPPALGADVEGAPVASAPTSEAAPSMSAAILTIVPPAGPLTAAPLAGDAEVQQVAMSLLHPFSAGGDRSEAVGVIQDALDKVLPPGDRIDAGPNRGIFGPRTEAAVKVFQQMAGLNEDGQVGRNTLRALDAALAGKPTPVSTPPVVPAGLDIITDLAAKAAIAQYHWDDRGTAPIGYTKGMALTYGRVYCKWKTGDPAVLEMASADKNAPLTDALSHYRDIFNKVGLDNSASGLDTLRHLFVLMLGLGMRETSGAHCEGRDTTNPNSNTADTAEAGLFQTSWNARTASPLLPRIFTTYSERPNSGWEEVFHQQVKCSDKDWAIVGTGTGADFQRLSKNCPAFAAEFATVALRNVRRHWGPINARAAEVRPEADAMFKAVQVAVDQNKLDQALLG